MSVLNIKDINLDIKKKIGEYLCVYDTNTELFNHELFINNRCKKIRYKCLGDCIYHGNPMVLDIIDELLRHGRNQEDNSIELEEEIDKYKDNDCITLHFKNKETTDYFCKIKNQIGFSNEILYKCCDGRGVVLSV